MPGLDFCPQKAASFIRQNLDRAQSGDSEACQLITALILSFWQLAGRSFDALPPSFLLVGRTDAELSPGRLLRGSLTGQYGEPTWKCRGTQSSDDGEVTHKENEKKKEEARKVMARAREFRQSLDRSGKRRSMRTECPYLFNEFERARDTLCSPAPLKRFRQGKLGDYGFVYGSDSCLSLSIGNEQDLALFLEHLKKDRRGILNPNGIDYEVRATPKQLSFLGWITPDEWSCDLTSVVLEKSLPLVFLPFSPMGGLSSEGLRDFTMWLNIQLSILRGRGHPPLPDASTVVLPGVAKHYEKVLVAHLQARPAHYGFVVQKLVRDLQQVTTILVDLLEKDAPKSDSIRDLVAPLYLTALHGITLGVCSLSFHPHGGISPAQEKKLLSFVRENQQVTRREISRRFTTVNAEERDKLLDELDSLGLLTLNGKEVHATSFESYIDAINSCGMMPKWSINP